MWLQDDRDYVSVRKKFFDLVPRGSIPVQLQSAENLRADLVHKRISQRQHGGGMPPPTPPDVLIALYTNSNLPLPASLRAHLTATPSAGGSAGNTNSAPSPETGTVLGKRKTATLATDGGDGGSVGGSIVAPFASAASSNNLSHLANGSGAATTGNATSSAFTGVAPSHMTPYSAFVATTTTTAAATNDKVKNEDYAQYLGNPAAYRPSPQGAGLTAILYKILHEPLKPTPTTLPPPHQQKMDSLQAQAVPRSLAALAERRAQHGGAVLSELGLLEDALLDVFNSHDKLAAYFAAKAAAAPSPTDTEAADETKTAADPAEQIDDVRSAELRDMEVIYQQSLGVARAVSQWLETYRPQFKRLKLTPHSLQRMYERRACGGALGGPPTFSASQASADVAASQDATEAAVPASQDEPPATAAAKPSSEEDEDGEALDEAEDDEDEDGAADDFEDLYASAATTPRTAGAATAMDTE